METVGGSIQLMVFIYAVAIVISFATAWIIKLVFFVIQKQTTGAKSKHGAKPAHSSGSADAPAKGTT